MFPLDFEKFSEELFRGTLVEAASKGFQSFSIEPRMYQNKIHNWLITQFKRSLLELENRQHCKSFPDFFPNFHKHFQTTLLMDTFE